MRSAISRWFLFGLLLGWSLTHASVFAQVAVQPGIVQPEIVRPPVGGIKSTPMSPEKLRAGLDKTVTIDYTGQSLTDVINHFRDRTGLNIVIDQMAILQTGMNPDDNVGQFQVKATNEKAGQALRRTLGVYRLCFIILEDSILVTSEEIAVFRQMRQRVSVDLEDVPLRKAVRELAKKHGINLVIDQRIESKFVDTKVSLQVDDTGIETALRLLAEQAELKAVRMGNVMYITTVGKAKAIREEEPHQFDNPLNPNFPGGIMPGIMRAGGFGGIGIGPGGVAPGLPALPIDPVVVPPPGIELPPAKGAPDAPPIKKQVIEIRPGSTPAPPRPAVDRPPAPPPSSTDPARP